MSLKDLLEEYRYDSDFIFEGLVIDITNQLKDLMEEKGLNKNELAKMMGVKPSYITKIFSGANISLKTIAKVLSALEIDVTISIQKAEKKKEKHLNKDSKTIDLSILEKRDEAEDIQFIAA